MQTTYVYLISANDFYQLNFKVHFGDSIILFCNLIVYNTYFASIIQDTEGT